MSRTNKRREAIYEVFRKELTKWKETQGTVFARPLPNPEGYGLSGWEARTLMTQLGLQPVMSVETRTVDPAIHGTGRSLGLCVEAADPPYVPPSDVDNEPF